MRIATVLAAALLSLGACSSNNISTADGAVTGSPGGAAAGGTTGSPAGGAGGSAAGATANCAPVGSITADECPPTWEAAQKDHFDFCRNRSQLPEFNAFYTTDVCHGAYRYTRFLFDAGPRYCVYDPTTLALRAYFASDGKAMFQKITCGSAPADFTFDDCHGAYCKGPEDQPETTCHVPADAPDAGVGACHARRAYVECKEPGGLTHLCLSDDPTRCADAPANATCTSQCQPNEYAMTCGRIGPGQPTDQTPPSTCRLVEPTPSGIGFYCCPCGT